MRTRTLWLSSGLLLALLLPGGEQPTLAAIPVGVLNGAGSKAAVDLASAMDPTKAETLPTISHQESAHSAEAGPLGIGFVGHLGGFVNAVVPQGRYVYVAEGPQLTVLDAGLPGTPVAVGRTALPPEDCMGPITDIALGNGYAYVVTNRGFGVADVSNPVLPVYVAWLPLSWDWRSLTVAGAYAYVIYPWWIEVIDVSDPFAPSRAGYLDYYGDPHILREVTVVDGLAYVTSDLGLLIFDATDPSELIEVGGLAMPTGAGSIVVSSVYAYITAGESGLRIVDVSDPTAPIEVGFYDTPGSASDVALAGEHAYVADGSSGLRIVDVSVVTAPTEIGSYVSTRYATSLSGVAIEEGIAYVVDLAYGLYLVNVSDPTSPVEVDHYEIPVEVTDIAPWGDHLYVTDQLAGLKIVDVSSPSMPVEVAGVELLGSYAVAVDDGYAYVLRSSWLSVIDVSDPLSPTWVTDYGTEGYAYALALNGRNLMVGVGGGLRIIDVATPSLPVTIGHYETMATPRAVASVGAYAYLAEDDMQGSCYLEIVDISNPMTPTQVSSIKFLGEFSAPYLLDVDVKGDYAYVVDWTVGLRVVDISSPEAPYEIGLASGVELLPTSAAIMGDYALIAGEKLTLSVWDVSSPESPTELTVYRLPSVAGRIVAANGQIYAGTMGFPNGFGLLILRIVDGEDSCSVSGRVLDSIGDPLANVLVKASGGASAMSDASGVYTLTGLITGTYTIAPALSGYIFEPPTRTVTVPPDATGQDFVASAIKPWTLMFYTAADNDPSQQSRLREQYERLQVASGNPYANILGLWDGVTTQARYDVFSPDGMGTSTALGEINMGCPQSLANFVQWAQEKYPASHYALIISDHGSGVGGVAYDYHLPAVGKDSLTPAELRAALSTVANLDIVYMDACLMATIESAYQLRGLADYYVASESVTWGAIRPDWFVIGHSSDQLEIPGIASQTEPQELAVAMSKSWVLQGKYVIDKPSTASVVRLSEVENVAQSASVLAGLIRDNLLYSLPILDAARDATLLQHFNSDVADLNITDEDEYVDLYDFAHLAYHSTEFPAIEDAALDLMLSIDQYLVYHEPGWSGGFWYWPSFAWYDWSHARSTGVSIYLPPPGTCPTFYNADWLDFAKGTNWGTLAVTQLSSSEDVTDTIEWGAMWVDYINLQDPDAVEEPYPPELIAPFSVPYTVYVPVVVR